MYYEIVLASLGIRTYRVWEVVEARGSNNVSRKCLTDQLSYEQAHRTACEFAVVNDTYVKVPIQEPSIRPEIVLKQERRMAEPVDLLSLIEL